MNRSVTVCLSEFSLESLPGGEGGSSELVVAELARAIRLYLDDRGSDRPGWAYPVFLRGEETGSVELELDLDEELWRALEAEAEGQGVSVSQMVAHAALYYAAQLDAGHITQRILDDLQGKEGLRGG